MPKIKVNGAELYYEDSGSGDETIVLCHGLICNCRMFDAQVEAFKDRYRCVTFDFRGHGKSEVARSGYDMDTFSEDTLKLIDELNCKPCHLISFSMGGFVSLRLAIRHPDFFRSLILVDTSADSFPNKDVFEFKMLSLIVRLFGFRPVINKLMPMIFSSTFLKNSANLEIKEKWKRYIIDNSRIGSTRTVKGIIERNAVYDQLDKISLPTLIIVGEKDKLTYPKDSARMHEKITNSKLLTIPHAGHLTPVEDSETVNNAIEEFLTNLN